MILSYSIIKDRETGLWVLKMYFNDGILTEERSDKNLLLEFVKECFIDLYFLPLLASG